MIDVTVILGVFFVVLGLKSIVVLFYWSEFKDRKEN